MLFIHFDQFLKMCECVCVCKLDKHETEYHLKMMKKQNLEYININGSYEIQSKGHTAYINSLYKIMRL